MGFKYINFRTSNSVDRIYTEDSLGYRRFGSMSDDIRVVYMGPSLALRYLNLDKSGTFFTNLSFGYLGYTNDFVLIDPYLLTGESVGFTYDIGYAISLSKNADLGFQISYLSGSLFEITKDDGTTKQTIKLEPGEYESLSRFDFSVGLRISF